MSPSSVTAEDLYLYAMHLLEPEEQSNIEAFLQHSPEARAELARVRGDLALFAMAIEQEEPAPMARQRFLNGIAREKKSPLTARTEDQRRQLAPMRDAAPLAASDPVLTPEAEDVRPLETNLPFRFLGSSDSDEDELTHEGFFASWVSWSGWAVACLLALSTVSLAFRAHNLRVEADSANASLQRANEEAGKAIRVMDVLRSSEAQRFQLTKQNSQPIPSARVTYVAESGSLVFQGANLDQLPPSKTYELWLIPSGEGKTPIPAGTFKPDERGYASVILPELPKGILANTFGVTMEDEGGSKTPTLPILMIGS